MRCLTALLVLGALLAACGVPREAAVGDPTAGFPHPAGYEDSHALVAEGGAAGCGSCHALRDGDPVRGAEPAAPACRSCHDAYPHPASLVHGAVHGPRWKADPAACDGCHGVGGDRPPGERAEGRCTACHSTYPHPDSWTEGAAHGGAVRARGGAACAGCHGSEGDALPDAACSECHLPPHPEAFASDHGDAWRDDPAACQACHERDGAPGRVPCARCHDLFPHPAGFATAHAGPAQRRGDGPCLACHEGGLPGPQLPVSCADACHGGSP